MRISRGDRRNLARKSDEKIYSFEPKVKPIGYDPVISKGKYIPAGENRNVPKENR